MLQRGTHPRPPSRHVHRYLQLLWKVSPLLYTIPPNTQGAPSLAVQTPIFLFKREPKSQKRPLWGSQISFSAHSSPSCLAHTLQHPHPSSTRLTPTSHSGGFCGHWHSLLHSWALDTKQHRATRSRSASLKVPIAVGIFTTTIGQNYTKGEKTCSFT